MHNLDLILMLAAAFVAALVLGYATQRLRLSPIVGYLLAGVLIGPQTPGFEADPRLAEQLAEVGIILLMFGVGLHFDLDDLLAVRKIAVPGAIIQCTLATLLGAVVAHALGWNWTAALVFGLCLSVASTVVLVRVLADNNTLHTRTGHLAVGWLIVEDLLTVVVLVLLPALFAPGGDRQSVTMALVFTVAKVAVLTALLFTVGVRAIPWVLTRVAKTGSRELFTLSVLAIALGIAVASTVGFGVSVALGAFLAGMIVGQSDHSSRAAAEALPLRDAFAVLFFVSIGMLFDPRAVIAAPALTLAGLGVVIVAKPIIGAAITRVMGLPLALTVPVALSRSQIGEFSFVLANAGLQLGVLPADAKDVVIAIAITSIVLSPLLMRLAGAVVAHASRSDTARRLFEPRRVRDMPAELPGGLNEAAHGAIVVGYGPTGRTLARLLRENGVIPTVVELSLENAQAARADGFRAVYGDAAHQPILIEAGAAQSDTLVLTSAGMEHSEGAIRVAREINPRIHVIARATYVRHVAALRAAGADTVFSGEAEVALGMTEAMMTRLGATAEQIDRERSRVRAEIRT